DVDNIHLDLRMFTDEQVRVALVRHRVERTDACSNVVGVGDRYPLRITCDLDPTVILGPVANIQEQMRIRRELRLVGRELAERGSELRGWYGEIDRRKTAHQR